MTKYADENDADDKDANANENDKGENDVDDFESLRCRRRLLCINERDDM